ncbi:wall-associated receptor kinase-like 8 [Spinacia oleracea]|uniref:Wall-associated receptor kinase-like 8 n=1 Tax=Spinacia oleracea TaxID=3562 RepID=A0A9R0J3A1_SPIOL|nr:wall-associated receptor kinase-like 8 [Spinacia oleracea]
MLFLLRLWLLVLTFSSMGTISTTTASITPANILTAANTTKPDCPRKCGNLTIPYPFGIGSDCSISFYFSVFCNTSYNPPRAFTMLDLGSNREADILEITESHMMLRNSRIASKCYNSQGNVTSENSLVFDIVNSPFTFSNNTNKLTVVGCDDYALISGYTGVLANGSRHQYNSVGCLALCSSPNELTPGSCSGLGCCQTSIPVGLQSFVITLLSLRNHTGPNISSFQPCAYAFLSGRGSFTFGGASDFAPNSLLNRAKDEVPMVLDWLVGDYNFSSNSRPTCNDARKNSTTYACQLNSRCVDVDGGGGGYHCKCNSGYEGNPYLEPGCTDINECAAGSNNPCSMVCVNTPGSFKCSCPSGYFGDGLIRNGTACTKIVNNSSSTLKKIILGLGISLGSILLSLCCWGLYVLTRRRILANQKARHFERNGGLLLQQQMSYDESVVARMKIFTIDELDKATDHFNENRILGKGGQGTVYKGMLTEGRIVAIKKSKIMAESPLIEFINEVVILSQINHRNIVKLLGCCLETEVPLLVNDYIPNGTLFQHIHQPSEEFPITWRMRLQIASDIAGALAYLHSSSSTPILHRDIKSSNILLDDKYRAKLSDFGTSRSIALDQTHVTTRVMGTFGYLDPEYFQSSQYTEKSDVYSFGVVLIELLTGEKAIRSILEEDRSLTSWFLSHMESSRLFDIVDTQLVQEGCSKEEFQTVADVAKRCLNSEGKYRPTMKEVLVEIEVVLSLHLPQQNWVETQHEGTKHAKNGVPYSSTLYLDNYSSNSAELSLLFNPR